MKNHFKIWTIPLFTIIVYGCSIDKEKSRYKKLVEYEGRYEYTNPESLVLAASNFDTTLYAIIDDAQYPLRYVSKDTFETPQKSPLVFKRNSKGEVASYLTDGKNFNLITKTTEKPEWFPRKELYNKAEAYQYQMPTQKTDGLLVGDLKNAFADSETIVNMVKETINGEFRDVHSILIWKDGKLVLEEYFYGYTEDKPHQLRSASKSFIGTLVGISIDQGKAKNENEFLLPVFKKEYNTIANNDNRKEKITIKDFLTYRHGMDVLLR